MSDRARPGDENGDIGWSKGCRLPPAVNLARDLADAQPDSAEYVCNEMGWPGMASKVVAELVRMVQWRTRRGA